MDKESWRRVLIHMVEERLLRNFSIRQFAVIKTLGTDEKMKLSDIYKKLAKMEIEIVEMDVKFDADKEIEFVKKNYKIWQEIKKDLLEILGVVKANWDKNGEVKGKGYFG